MSFMLPARSAAVAGMGAAELITSEPAPCRKARRLALGACESRWRPDIAHGSPRGLLLVILFAETPDQIEAIRSRIAVLRNIESERGGRELDGGGVKSVTDILRPQGYVERTAGNVFQVGAQIPDPEGRHHCGLSGRPGQQLLATPSVIDVQIQ